MLLGMDMKITNKCSIGCPFCHENSIPGGKHGDLDLAREIIEVNRPLWVAFGGGSIFEHEDWNGVIDLIEWTLMQGIQVGITVNTYSIFRNIEKLEPFRVYRLPIYKNQEGSYGRIAKDYYWHSLIWLGLSVPMSDLELAATAYMFLRSHTIFRDRIVLHFINRLHTKNMILGLLNTINSIHSTTFPGKMNILILGYKDFGRGEAFKKSTFNKYMFETDKYAIKPEDIDYIKEKYGGGINIALDTLAVEQIYGDRDMPSNFLWADGERTVYVDLVNKKFAKNSYSMHRYDIQRNLKIDLSVLEE